MENKTIANLVILALVTCVFGYVADSNEALFTIGGLGIIVGSILMAVRLHKIDKTDWLPKAIGIVTGVYFLVVLGNDATTIQVMAMAYWVVAVWGIVRLYKVK